MKLITELSEDVKFIKEDGDENYYIEGIFLQGNAKNKNGRVYPLPVLKAAVNAYENTFIKTKRSLGELGHPTGPALNLHLASHLIVELRQDGENYIGKAHLLDTPNGKIAKNFLDEGIQLGVSSRGLGSIKESNGAAVVQADFHLSTVDIVADPSAPDAFVQGIMEGREWIWNNGELSEQVAATIKHQIQTRPAAEIEAGKRAFLKTFMESLR